VFPASSHVLIVLMTWTLRPFFFRNGCFILFYLDLRLPYVLARLCFALALRQSLPLSPANVFFHSGAVIRFFGTCIFQPIPVPRFSNVKMVSLATLLRF
jgi:hypothetical protein